jgi:hypothetical protein
MFKVGINKIHWNTNNNYNLQSRLQIDEILDFPTFKLMVHSNVFMNFHLSPFIVKMHQNSNVKIWKNMIFINQFQTYTLVICIALKFFKFCIQLIINSMEA